MDKDTNLVDFHGTPILEKQRDALVEILQLAKLPSIPIVPSVDFNHVGVVIQPGYVVGLNLVGTGLESVPESIGDLWALERLHLSNNKLVTLTSRIKFLGNLRYLYLDYNQIEDLPEEISGAGFLEELWLEYNLFHQLPGSITSLNRLRWLSLHHNPLGEITPPLQEWIQQLKRSGCYVEI